MRIVVQSLEAEIVAAFDADEVGRKLVDVIREAVARVASRTERTDLVFKAHLAVKEGEDWNLVLQNGGMILLAPGISGLTITDRTSLDFHAK
jgi:predicted nuclease with TOPRIM domain